MKAILVALIAATVAVSSDKSRFDNYRFYSVNIENEVQLKALRELSEVSDSVSSQQ